MRLQQVVILIESYYMIWIYYNLFNHNFIRNYLVFTGVYSLLLRQYYISYIKVVANISNQRWWESSYGDHRRVTKYIGEQWWMEVSGSLWKNVYLVMQKWELCRRIYWWWLLIIYSVSWLSVMISGDHQYASVCIGTHIWYQGFCRAICF